MPTTQDSDTQSVQKKSTRALSWKTGRFIGCMLIAIIVAAVLSLVAIGISAGGVSTADLSYNSLHYDTQVLKNGDLRIKQRINIRLAHREDDEGDTKPWRQLYQQYTINPDNLTSISDISVRNISDDQTYTQGSPIPPSQVQSTANWDQEQAGHWYVANVSDADNPSEYQADTTSSTGKYPVEIGWNIPQTNQADSVVFEISMTFHGVSTAHPDVTNFQWEPFGASNQVPIETVTASLRFPEGITSTNSWAWLHYSGVSETSRADDGTLKLTAHNVNPGQHLDVVAMFDSSASDQVVRSSNTNAKQRIMDDETQQESKARDSARLKARLAIAAWIVAAILAVLVSYKAIRSAFSTYGESRYSGDVEYWRDPPEMSPAAAAELNDFLEGASTNQSSRQMASSVLSLASKQAISIYPGPVSSYYGVDLLQTSPVNISGMLANQDQRSQKAFNSTSTIVIRPVCTENRESLHLSASEDAALHILEVAASRLQTPVFDLKQMQQNFKKWESGYKEQERFTSAVAREFAVLKATAIRGSSSGWGTLGVILAVVALVVAALSSSGSGLAVGLIVGFVLLTTSIFALTYGKFTVLTQKGQHYAGQVHGLRRYLLDFSAFQDRGVNDLVLWDRYLVYAAAFGISNQALKQLALAYPQLSDPQWLDEHASGSLLYWTYRPWAFAGAAYGYGMGARMNTSAGVPGATQTPNIGAGFGDIGSQLTSSFSSIHSTIQAAAPSSSSGGSFGGGGFAGGGGGSGGGSFGGR
ncbi:DUF2207 domain-containing protein [Bifidobacterium sp.]|uniref:DUF2207 domain-containing protein n=1 Tax=Bifidobacterium sp. TaxID=41200 RepID=UPI0025BC322F|nr:DUF2207 domain-containing protein [Bifidobacterium sp.]MCI1635236.1 DUF2207 domain-containing protein [Bifidobacterium sp.]